MLLRPFQAATLVLTLHAGCLEDIPVFDSTPEYLRGPRHFGNSKRCRTMRRKNKRRK